MNDFKECFYKILLDVENFYMKQYYSNFHKREVFLAVKSLKEGIYCVLICDEENEEIDYLEAIQYIKTFKKLFSLNMIILSSGEEYTYKNTSSMVNKLVINKKSLKVVECDSSCMPLKHIFDNYIQMGIESNTKGRKKLLQLSTITFIIIGINAAVYFFTAFISSNIFDISTSVLIEYGAKVDVLIKQGQIWRLLTCAFLHSGLIHLGFNMYSLYILGPQIQQIYGTAKYLTIYIFSCITSSLLSYFMSPYGISIGASGAIFGLLGALLAFAIIERNKISKRFISSIVQIIIINLFIGLSIRNIDNFAHIGGLVGGIFIGVLSYKIKGRKYEI